MKPGVGEVIFFPFLSKVPEKAQKKAPLRKLERGFLL